MSQKNENIIQSIVAMARTIKEVEKMREKWELMKPFPSADIDYFLTLIRFRKNVIRPYVIMLSRGEKPKTLIVGRIEYISKELKIGTKSLYRSKVKSLIIDIGCLVGDLSLKNSTIIITELCKSLKKKEADVVAFSEVSVAICIPST